MFSYDLAMTTWDFTQKDGDFMGLYPRSILGG